jgi:hypothetical protein
MNRPANAIAVLTLAFVSVWACTPAPNSNAAQTATPQTAAPQSAAAAPSPAGTPPAPVKHATMICRNSQDGRKVECGTPNAVMVGIKED